MCQCELTKVRTSFYFVFLLSMLSTYYNVQAIHGFEPLVPTSSEEVGSFHEQEAYDSRTIDFNHERCQLDTVSGYYTEISHFYKVDSFLVGENEILELLVRFKGPSDGHVALTPFANTSEPAYIIIMGSYENKLSEIRLAIDSSPVFKINTPGILSPIQFRGFQIRYNEKRGEIWVYSEGSYMPLLHWKDPKPLKIRYFSFSAYDDVVVEVAFNCKPKDLHSLIFQHKPGSKGPEELRTGLLEHYDVKTPPPSMPVSVGINLILNYFTVEEVEQLFWANVWLSLSWVDPRLSWNTSETNSSFILRFSSHEIWKPDITLFNNAYPTDVDHYGDTFLMVYPDGKVTWTPPARLASHCRLNLIRWPYDTHTCHLKFGSWTHSGAEIDLKVTTVDNKLSTGDDPNQAVIRPVDTQLFIGNSEWTMISTNVSTDREFYACCYNPYVVATYSFELQRNSPAYVASIVIPIIVVSIVNIMVFLLPPTAGEKITLGAINSFILCVYLIYFQVKLPALGDQLPLLVLMFSCNLVLVGISLIMSVIVINLSRVRKASSPPQFFRMFCNANFAQFLGLGHIVPYVSQTHTRLDEGVEMRSPHENGNSSRIDFDKDDQTANLVVDHDSVPYMVNAEWILLASMIDRLTLIVYSVVCGITLALCLA